MEDGNVKPNCMHPLDKRWRYSTVRYGKESCLECKEDVFEVWRWPSDKPDPALVIAHNIYVDCLDRRGIKWEFSKVKRGIRQEILSAWANIIRPALNKPHADCGQDDCPCVRRGIDLMAKSMRGR